MVLEGRRIAQPFLELEVAWGRSKVPANRIEQWSGSFRKGWEESPNTKGRDAA